MKAGNLADPNFRQRAFEARQANQHEIEIAREARKPKHRGYGALIKFLRRTICPKRVEGRIRHFENGSLRAAIELHCLAFCADDKGAIRDCTSAKTCPLHPHRPYQSDEERRDLHAD